MNKYPHELLKLIAFFKKLPGVGSKTAERFAFQLLKWPKEELSAFGALLAEIPLTISHCPECGCLIGDAKCLFCHDSGRDAKILCIISSPKDAFSMEKTLSYKGLYHVTGALLSPLDGTTPDQLNLDRLKKRIEKLGIKEIIIAFDSTVEGDATALYIKEQLQSFDARVSRLAFGLPIGSTLDYVDGGTLARALMGRQFF